MFKQDNMCRLLFTITVITLLISSVDAASGLIVDNPSGYRVILILVDFPDVLGGKTPGEISNLWLSVAGFYNSSSYGQFSLYTYSIAGWYTLANNMSYYGANDGTIDTNGLELVIDAINAADPYVDFTQYDRVVIVHAGGDEAFTGVSTDIWSMTWYSLGISTDDGATVNHASVVSEDDPLGIFAHEVGHLIKTDKVGILPDLYDTVYSNEYVGLWSVMAEGAWAGIPIGSSPTSFTAPEKYWLGWIVNNMSVIKNGYASIMSIHRLEDGGDVLAIQIPLASNKYYMIEYRRKVGIDTAIPDQGVIITYTDETISSGHGVIKVIDANPGTKTKDDAAFDVGTTWVKETLPLYVKVYNMNTTHATVYVQRGITDIVVESISISQSPEGSYNFDVNILNNGSLYIDTKFLVSIYLDGVLIQSYSLGPFPPDAVRTLSFTKNLDKGVHILNVSLDTTQKIFEANETNNFYAYRFEVGEPDIIHIVNRTPEMDLRVDVGSIQVIGYRLVFDNGSILPEGSMVYLESGDYGVIGVDGWVFFNVTSNTVSRISYGISSISYGSTEYSIVYDVSPVSIIWDKVRITLRLNDVDGHVDVGSVADISYTAVYLYDMVDAKPYLDIVLDKSPYSDTVGKIDVSVIGIRDEKYGLTVFESNILSIIFDRIVVTLTLDDPDGRIDVGSEARINITVYYEYDGSDASKYVVISLNDTLYSDTVGVKWITVASVYDGRYGLTTFKSNIVSIVYDAVVVKLSPEELRIDVGMTAPVKFEAHYASDGSLATPYISITLNSSLKSDEVRSVKMSVLELVDSKYGLTRFVSNTVKVIWDMVIIEFADEYYTTYIGIPPELEYDAYYAYDHLPADVTIIFNTSISEVVKAPGEHRIGLSMVLENTYGLKRYTVNFNVLKIRVIEIELPQSYKIVVWNIFERKYAINLSELMELDNYLVTVDDKPYSLENGYLNIEIPILPPYRDININIIYRDAVVYTGQVKVLNMALISLLMITILVIVGVMLYWLMFRRER